MPVECPLKRFRMSGVPGHDSAGLVGPWIVKYVQLYEQTQLVGPHPLLDHTVVLEVHDGDRPLLHRSSRRAASGISTRVGPTKCGPEHDRVAGHDELVDPPFAGRGTSGGNGV